MLHYIWVGFKVLPDRRCIELLPDASVKKTAMPEFQEAQSLSRSAVRMRVTRGGVRFRRLLGFWVSV